LGRGVLALVWGMSGTSIVLVEDILKLCVKASVFMILVGRVALRPNVDSLTGSGTTPRSKLIYNVAAIRSGSIILLKYSLARRNILRDSCKPCRRKNITSLIGLTFGKFGFGVPSSARDHSSEIKVTTVPDASCTRIRIFLLTTTASRPPIPIYVGHHSKRRLLFSVRRSVGCECFWTKTGGLETGRLSETAGISNFRQALPTHRLGLIEMVSFSAPRSPFDDSTQMRMICKDRRQVCLL
jgi:hypothetical protein